MSYHGGAGKINFTVRGKKENAKRVVSEREIETERDRERKCVETRWLRRARMEEERRKTGDALAVRLLVQRNVHRIAIQTFSAHFFMPPA